MPFSFVRWASKVFGPSPSIHDSAGTRVKVQSSKYGSKSNMELQYDRQVSIPRSAYSSSSITLGHSLSSRSPSHSSSSSLRSYSTKVSHTPIYVKGNDDTNADFQSINTVDSKSRLSSRGREVYYSTGRGGAGNIHRASIPYQARPTDPSHDFSGHPHGHREAVPGVRTKISTGRGGAGNIRAPFEGDTSLSDADVEVIRSRVAVSADVPRSFGRGGAGNISIRSR
ncbi:hypothetical protein H2248_008023 [Termitomyces sp. 'cryptogamus']|nr:hypothetical protein H2248_008023 [Termitomyces sp. 'cryptogamus']